MSDTSAPFRLLKFKPKRTTPAPVLAALRALRLHATEPDLPVLINVMNSSARLMREQPMFLLAMDELGRQFLARLDSEQGGAC
jgi:hypothetical protein